MTGLKELTVQGAKSFADASARHRWQVPSDYNVALDCLERPFHKPGAVALHYEDRAELESLCEKLLVNPLIEDYEIEEVG